MIVAISAEREYASWILFSFGLSVARSYGHALGVSTVSAMLLKTVPAIVNFYDDTLGAPPYLEVDLLHWYEWESARLRSATYTS